MNAFIKFNKGIMIMSIHWRLWLGLLVTFNLVIPLFFFDRLEAKIVLVALLFSMILMTILTGISGFNRLLGMGHIFWLPLLYFLWSRLDQIPMNNLFGIWIRALIMLNAVSLLIDSIDVIRFISGDREETIKEP